MGATANPGRVAALWYLLLVFLGPLRLIYIPNTLFVHGNAAATVSNIAANEWLFRAGIVADLAGAIVLVMLTLAFYRLFAGVSRDLAVQVVIFGGVMPALVYIVNSVSDAAALMVVKDTHVLAAFDQPQRDALAWLFLQLHDHQVTSAEILWGVWLFPLGILIWKSGFLPKFLGAWLLVNGVAYVALSLAGLLVPDLQDAIFLYAQPAFFGEIALVLWLLIKGATPLSPPYPTS
jgi:hypothetical protein